MRLLDRARLDDDVVEVPALGVMRKAAVGGPVAQEAMVSSKRSAASSMGTQKPENSLCDNPPNRPDYPSVRLGPGQVYRHLSLYRFSAT
jgi:hypothetical protein